jgi:hypothetical protein
MSIHGKNKKEKKNWKIVGILSLNFFNGHIVIMLHLHFHQYDKYQFLFKSDSLLASYLIFFS